MIYYVTINIQPVRGWSKANLGSSFSCIAKTFVFKCQMIFSHQAFLSSNAITLLVVLFDLSQSHISTYSFYKSNFQILLQNNRLGMQKNTANELFFQITEETLNSFSMTSSQSLFNINLKTLKVTSRLIVTLNLFLFSVRQKPIIIYHTKVWNRDTLYFTYILIAYYRFCYFNAKIQ